MEKINLQYTNLTSRYKQACPNLKATGDSDLTVC